MRTKKLIIGNWKMNPRTVALAKTTFTEVKKATAGYKNIDVALAVPCIYMPELGKLVSTRLALAAQNIAAEKEGPYTGEVSVDMLAPYKVQYVLLGHSERRTLGETNAMIAKKVALALKAKMTPVLCVGEAERDAGMWYLGAVKTQIEECLALVPKAAMKNIVIAYEPIWAISSTANHRDAQPSDFEEMRIYIRKVLSDMCGKNADDTAILYGGSVDEKNAVGFLVAGGADGLLPGRASLTPKKFIKILQLANDIR